jgi:hypothetical protein
MVYMNVTPSQVSIWRIFTRLLIFLSVAAMLQVQYLNKSTDRLRKWQFLQE